MNRFKDLIDDLAKSRKDLLAKDLLMKDEKLENAGDVKKSPQLRLPYSSDPVPLEKPWAS